MPPSKIWWIIYMKLKKLGKTYDRILRYVFNEKSYFHFIYRPDNKSLQQKDQMEKITFCIYFHRNLLGLTEKVQKLFSPIIFFQFFLSCLQICAITLELILVTMISLVRYFFNLTWFIHSMNILPLIDLFKFCQCILQFWPCYLSIATSGMNFLLRYYKLW